MIEISDEYAERGIVGCALQGAISDELDVQWIVDERRKILFLGADCLRQHGNWHIPETAHPAHLQAATFANAERVAHAVARAEVWESAEDPRAELKRCLDGATLLALLPYYVGRVRDRFLKIREITEAERHLQQLVAEVR